MSFWSGGDGLARGMALYRRLRKRLHGIRAGPRTPRARYRELIAERCAGGAHVGA